MNCWKRFLEGNALGLCLRRLAAGAARRLLAQNRNRAWRRVAASLARRLQLLVEQVSVGERTCSSRGGRFPLPATAVLPDRLQIGRPTGRYRILTVGCASGKRPTHRDRAARPSRWPPADCPSGIVSHAALVGKAERALFSVGARATPQHLPAGCFRRDGLDYRLRDELRTLVHFENATSSI